MNEMHTISHLTWHSFASSSFLKFGCLVSFVSLVKHSLLSVASTPSEVVKQVLASIESHLAFGSFEPR